MAWSALDIDTSWQTLALLSELHAAYGRRRALLLSRTSPAALDAPAAGDIVEDHILSLQTALTASAIRAYAIDPSATIIGLSWSSSYPSAYASLSALYAAAGIPDGLRRVPEGTAHPADWTDYDDASYSYGLIQAGDMLGPWLFADLRSLCGALTVYLFSTTPSTGDSADLYEVDDTTPFASYPTASPGYTSGGSDNGMLWAYEGDLSRTWLAIHDRPLVLLSDTGAGSKTVDLIGRTSRHPDPDDPQPDVLGFFAAYGTENTATHVMASLGTVTDDDLSVQLGGDQIDSWSSVFDSPPGGVGLWQFDSAYMFTLAFRITLAD